MMDIANELILQFSETLVPMGHPLFKFGLPHALGINFSQQILPILILKVLYCVVRKGIAETKMAS
jgi:hypothetical protein